MLELNEIFLKLFNMSISASWLVLAIVIFRFVLKKSPKWISCCMWALVGVRLVNPFSFESFLSLIPSAETVTSENFFYSQSPTITTGVQSFNHYVNPIISESLAPTPGASVNPAQILGFVLSSVWLTGMVVMFLYALVSFLRLKKKVAASVNIKDNIYMCDEVKTPFILGVIKPKIYIPSDMDEGIMNYVISHEKAHLKRKDYLWKPIGFILLSVYWFNPILWLSYILLCRDIELACDEKVIREMEIRDKKAYSEALLSCSVSQKMITACPVAFGEIGVKQRIKSVLNYKKPAFWVIVVAVVASVAVGVCFMTDPKSGTITDESYMSYDNGSVVFGEKINSAQTITVKMGVESYYETTRTNGLDTVINLLTSLSLEKIDDVDENENLSYENTIEVANETFGNIKIYFSSDLSKLWFYDYETKSHSSFYKIKNTDTVKDFFENEEYKTDAPVWECNFTSSAYGYGDVHLYVDKKYEITSFEASDGTVSEINFEQPDPRFNGIKWCPDVSNEIEETQIIIHTICENENVDFNLTMKLVGKKNLSTYYLLSAEDTVIAGFGNNYEYMLDYPESDESEKELFTWIFNPMASATWWFETTFAAPEGYDIISADATSGTASVGTLYYGEPDGEKCVRWSPYMNEKVVNDEDTQLNIIIEKDGEEFGLIIKISLSGAESDGVREYTIEPVNCSITEDVTAKYEIAPTPIEDLDTAVSQAIFQINSGKNWLGDCPAEGHIILGKKERENVTAVYVLESFSSYGFDNGWFISKSGHSTACVMTFVNIDGGYVFQNAEYTQDGAMFDESVEQLFPLHLRKRVMLPGDSDLKSMNNQCVSYAQRYLQSIGRQAKIGSYGDVPRVWLTDLGVSVEVSNKLLSLKGIINACEVGYYEENGITYRTYYCEEEKIIIYTASYPEKENFEVTAIDATTGEEIPFKEEYLEKAKTYEDYVSTSVKEKEYTTKAYVVE